VQSFEGPVALLMHLIEKNQLNIYDIPIAEVTEQYLAYLQAMEQFNIEIASEFLVMAATLLQIKSRMLLPKPPPVDVSELEEDPRQELVNRLLEYRRYKEAALCLGEMFESKEKMFTRPLHDFGTKMILPNGLKIEELIAAFATLWESGVENFAVVTREEISIQDKMQDIIFLLRKNDGKMEFSQCFIRSGSRTEMVTAFLALLELIKLNRIGISQKHSFGPIYLTWGEVVN